MDLGPAFPAQAQAAEEVQPGEGALDDPAQLAQAGAVLGLAAGDDGFDAARPQRAAVLVVVVAAVSEQAVEDDELLVCDPFRLEAMYSARDAREFVALSEELDALRQAPCDDAVWRLATQAQAALAADHRVSHRVKPVDLLVAAAAHRHHVDVVHYDHDFDVLAAHTDLRFTSRWLARRGTLN